MDEEAELQEMSETLGTDKEGRSTRGLNERTSRGRGKEDKPCTALWSEHFVVFTSTETEWSMQEKCLGPWKAT